MEATSQLGGHGAALARSTLSDVRGVVGSGLQTLVLAPFDRILSLNCSGLETQALMDAAAKQGK